MEPLTRFAEIAEGGRVFQREELSRGVPEFRLYSKEVHLLFEDGLNYIREVALV